ncbi:ribonuclease P protein component [Gordonia hankookensis]|uniref:Ribonuclease P protein component n=1 Tax=Gordonia hankookensis TaxID=589403 RepID=A0ABR7WDI1_9ACTN|nr:ribonuclease P protein component [Gordonia hankookensis]MBD1320458.1 ribonuclease P protein component [Gordonia hankookensis]
MVAAAHRISRGSDFDRTLKTGVRVTTRDLVVHVLPLTGSTTDPCGPRDPDVATVGGPWLGLIVSKTVGNAVIRHRVARRLRAAFHQRRADFRIPQTMMVIRARRSTVELSSIELSEQIADALSRRRVREAFDPSDRQALR